MKPDVIIHPYAISSKPVKNIYDAQILELAEVRNPGLSEEKYIEISKDIKKTVKPIYIEYSWKEQLLKCVNKKEFYELKTNRNKLLITKKEQEVLQVSKISVAGMSVGSSALYGLVGTGIGGSINIADDDTFSTTNLNRVAATAFDVGEMKVSTAYKRSKEMDPFMTVNMFSQRIDERNIHEFMHKGKTDLIIEEIDDIKMKIAMREYARKFKVPLIMLTNLGDSVMIDIERYDSSDKQKLFNGFVDESLIERIKKEDGTESSLMHEFIKSLITPDFFTERILESLSAINKKLVGRPQLYGTVALDGGITPYLARRILLDDLSAGRYSIELSTIS